jgi:outer membrane lipopolysaccharide assembly protein LptE/RlpB
MKKILLSCIAVLFCISILAQNTVNLRMNLEKNKVYRLKSVSEQTITQTVNGNQQTTESKVDYTFSLKMIDATADFMITEVHFDTLITNTNTMGKTVSISSVKEGDIKSTEMADVLSCIMNRLSKNTLFVKMDFAGKPLEIVNLKMLSDMIMIDTSSIALAGQTAAAVKKQIINTVSDNSLKTMIGMFTWCLPDKQVKAGDNWNVTQQMSSGGMMLDIITAYHLDGLNGNNANISVESNIKAAENADPIESGGAKVTYNDIAGLSKSNMVIDTRTGLIVEDKAKTHITGNLGVTAPGFSMQIPMDINGEAKVIALQ